MGVSIHYRGKMADISTVDVLCDEMALVADKMDVISSELSRVTGSNIEKLSADELASMIEALILNKYHDN